MDLLEILDLEDSLEPTDLQVVQVHKGPRVIEGATDPPDQLEPRESWAP